MKTLLYILCFALVITSCKKEEPIENESITITGKIVQDCGMSPLANSPIKLLVSTSQAFTGSDVTIYEFNSDAIGYFTFTLTNPPTSFTTQLRFGGTIIKGVIRNTSEDIGTLIASPTANFVVKLKINNPYNVGDTLYIYDYAIADHIKIIAPFTDKIFSLKHNFSNIQNRTLTNKNAVEVQLNHSVYNGTPGTASFNELSQSFESFIIEGCSGAVDTIVKVIN